ncbi:MAG: DNA topoisomerase (ATP-hydrolyzing) subunit A [Clostridiales bacterium]|nr:DNA topoisomerase (ATP-hydrolyzing) subunit A [Clostridiales bacterium]
MKKPIIQEQQITDTLEENFMPYAMSVIVSRAIPEIDGLKPSHRKLLYTMYKMGLLNGNLTKSANVVGQTMKLNPHGDGAIYETMVRLTEGNGALLLPLVQSKGNFGRVYSRDMAYAAARYTEVKLAKICSEIFCDMDKDTIDFVDNYDGTMKEPTLLPTTFPNILANPNMGIAVGMASNICSFNLKELCDATIKLMHNPEAELSEIIEVLPAPDFPTGGELLYDKSEIEEVYRTGRGSLKVRAKYSYDKSQNCIDIYEIPYTTTVEVIIDKIVDLVKSNKIREISDIRDETDLKGLKITIDLKRGTDPDKLMAKLFKMTTLQDSFGCNFNILVEGSPMVLGVSDIICEWLRFRRSCIKRALKFDINKKSEKLHLLEGLAVILLDIDKAIKIVRETEDDSMVVPNLMKGFGISEVQAEFVAEIKLRNLNKDYILKRTAEIEDLKKELEELKSTIESKAKINKIIEKQLKQVAKKFGTERRTALINPDEITEADVESEIKNYGVKFFRTGEGYLKKISLVSLRTSGVQRVKEDDEIVQEIEAQNSSELLFFSKLGDVYKLKAYDMPDGKASQLGEFIPNLVEIGDKDNIMGMIVTDNFEGDIVFCFENGKIARVPLKSYETKTNRKKLANAFSAKSPLVKLFYLSSGEETDLVLFSDKGRAVTVNTGRIPLKTTRSTQGISVMTSKKDSVVKTVVTADKAELKNIERFRTKTIPAAGAIVRDEDKGIEQTKF